MMKSMMIFTAALVVLALSAAVPCEATTTNAELYHHVESTQKVMPSPLASSMKKRGADFEKFDAHAKITLRELTTLPIPDARHLALEAISSRMIMLSSLSFPPVISMSTPPSPPRIITMSPTKPVPEVEVAEEVPGDGSMFFFF
jgi:hypothetical protein